MLRERSRNDVVDYSPVYIRFGSGPFEQYVPKVKYAYEGRQITISEGHARARNGKYYAGGPFFTVRIEPNIQTRFINPLWESLNWKFSGPISIPGVPATLKESDIPIPGLSGLDPFGAQAISAIDPTNPNASTGVALAESLDTRFPPIPVIQGWKKRTSVARAAAGEFLSAEFGWLPLVRDITDTAQSVKDANTIMENYSNASGTDVHREFAFPIEHSDKSTVVRTNTQAMINPGLSPGPPIDEHTQSVTKHTSTTVKRWFSGSFTYHIGNNQSSVAKCLGFGSEADKLFGLTLTPDVVWELTPWSWAIDWASNANAVISNASALGLAGLVMRYGFIMEETSIVDTYTMPSTGLYGVLGTVPPSTVTTTIKRRQGANPFGFGVKIPDLSPEKLAIIAALGITLA